MPSPHRAEGRPRSRDKFRGGKREGPKFPEPREVEYRKEGKLRTELVDEEARSIAKSLEDLAPTQLRRFFDTVKALERQVDLVAEKNGGSRQAAFQEVWPQFAMLKAQAAYAKGRLKDKMPQAFLQFMVDHVHAVGGREENFKDFISHFEAVVAFHKFFGKEKN